MTENKPSTRRFRDILAGVPRTETQPNAALDKARGKK